MIQSAHFPNRKQLAFPVNASATQGQALETKAQSKRQKKKEKLAGVQPVQQAAPVVKPSVPKQTGKQNNQRPQTGLVQPNIKVQARDTRFQHPADIEKRAQNSYVDKEFLEEFEMSNGVMSVDFNLLGLAKAAAYAKNYQRFEFRWATVSWAPQATMQQNGMFVIGYSETQLPEVSTTSLQCLGLKVMNHVSKTEKFQIGFKAGKVINVSTQDTTEKLYTPGTVYASLDQSDGRTTLGSLAISYAVRFYQQSPPVTEGVSAEVSGTLSQTSNSQQISKLNIARFVSTSNSLSVKNYMGDSYFQMAKQSDFVVVVRTDLKKIRASNVELTCLDANRNPFNPNARLESYKPVNGAGQTHFVICIPELLQNFYLKIEVRGFVESMVPFAASISSQSSTAPVYQMHEEQGVDYAPNQPNYEMKGQQRSRSLEVPNRPISQAQADKEMIESRNGSSVCCGSFNGQ